MRSKKMNVTEQLQVLRQPIVEQCKGEKSCSKITDEEFCSIYAFPSAKWRVGNCPMATHIEVEEKKDSKKINPLKASKRGGK